jgi:hypothetical protein
MEPSTAVRYINKDLRGYSFKGQDLTGSNFNNSDISGCDFSGAILRNANFEGVEVGINWSEISIITIVNIILAPLWAYSNPSPTDDSAEEYFSGLVRGLISWMILAGFFTIHFVNVITEYNIPLFSIGLVFVLLCLGLASVAVIKIVKCIVEDFGTSFRNADLTGAILDDAIYRKADLTGAIFENP